MVFQPRRPPSPDRDWNKTLPATQGDAQSWISVLARQTDACSSFSELFDTPIDFSNFIMNWLGVATLTPELLAGPTYELMRGSYYGHIKWIKDLVPRAMWIQEPINYDRHALSGVSHWGRKRQQFYGFTVNQEFALDVYSKRRIIAVTKLKIIDGTLNDVRNALDDRLKGIRMQYLPTTIWRRGDKDRAAAMIQAIDKMLKTRMIMRSLEKFIGGRVYEGDFRIRQRTI
nr:hypothetical protein [Tanacetum cinerariifolium]